MMTFTLGVRFLSLFRTRLFLRFALIGMAVAALGLTACGRKGPLDPPPGASLAGEPQANMPDLMSKRTSTPIGGEAKDGEAGIGPDGQPVAAKGPKKHFLLDSLLN
ncbi:MAG TPA: lipoprotein [Pseudolabrys sp.]|nr:lipoprotein [Pseudolabrys sp.]